VHENNFRDLSVYLSLTQLVKMLCHPYYAYVFSSTKLKIRAEQLLPGSEGEGGEKVEDEGGGRNDLNNVHTSE
jgi:hypothetical protein